MSIPYTQLLSSFSVISRSRMIGQPVLYFRYNFNDEYTSKGVDKDDISIKLSESISTKLKEKYEI